MIVQVSKTRLPAISFLFLLYSKSGKSKMKTSGLSQIAAVLGVFYLRTHRFYKGLIDICTGIRYDPIFDS